MTIYTDSGTVRIYIQPARAYIDLDTAVVNIDVVGEDELFKFVPSWFGTAFSGNWHATVPRYHKWSGKVSNKYTGEANYGVGET